MTVSFEVAFTTLFARLEVTDASEIRLDVGPNIVKRMYVAESAAGRTYVDRSLAVALRRLGAAWSGDIRRDPYASA